MSVAIDTVDLVNLTQMGLDNELNFAVRESLELAVEELEYYFYNKDKMVEMYLSSFNYNKINFHKLINDINLIYQDKDELEILIRRIEKRITRENISKSVAVVELGNCISDISFQCAEIIPYIRESLNTYQLNGIVHKGIQAACKKVSTSALPKALNKMTAKVDIGEQLMKAFGIGTQDARERVKNQLRRCIEGYTKVYRIEVISAIKRDIIVQLYATNEHHPVGTKLKKVKTA